MKNISSKLFIASLIIAGLASCKNNYTCNCMFYNDGKLTYYDTSLNNFIKKDAIFYCDKLESDFLKEVLIGDKKDTVYSCNLNKIN